MILITFMTVFFVGSAVVTARSMAARIRMSMMSLRSRRFLTSLWGHYSGMSVTLTFLAAMMMSRLVIFAWWVTAMFGTTVLVLLFGCTFWTSARQQWTPCSWSCHCFLLAYALSSVLFISRRTFRTISISWCPHLCAIFTSAIRNILQDLSFFFPHALPPFEGITVEMSVTHA